MSFMIMNSRLVRGTAASSAVRVGLLGCGGRGTADASDLVDTGGARVVALADMFQDQLDTAKDHFDKLNAARGYSGSIDRSQMFLGPAAYQQISQSKEVDAVVVTTPPYFHPQHLGAAVDAGKHVYCEKPVAIDVPGAKTVLDIGQRADGKVSLDVGFQIRNATPFVELVDRIHKGAIGKIACGEVYYHAAFIDRPAWPDASPAERRLRNWIYDRTLSGDIIVEQNIHVIDVCNWVLKTHPLKAQGSGGRGIRSDAGDVYGHYNVVFYYPDNVHVGFNSTQFDKGWWDVNERFFGSKGVSESHYSGPCAIYGDEPWAWKSQQPEQTQPENSTFSATGVFHDNLADADRNKKAAFIDSITSGKFHNQAALGVESALSAILGRAAVYEAGEVAWDELLRSNEKWDAGIDLNKLS
jgi:predicted dehydrogenase